ncbi:hypothetical protein NDU88_005733 [Pleurodeles waltl]|uniref:Uncharacterized protein n=1 Tax=Pleurodeles waltl TaxID=8319 RepID=A0AAV7NR84_PLEWA|nr:hypothetical protein NDU88_005733 [Pleurodeles waltl]
MQLSLGFVRLPHGTACQSHPSMKARPVLRTRGAQGHSIQFDPAGASPRGLRRGLSARLRAAGLSARLRAAGLSARLRAAGLSARLRAAGLSARLRAAGPSAARRLTWAAYLGGRRCLAVRSLRYLRPHLTAGLRYG